MLEGDALTSGARFAYLGLICAYLAAIVVQVFLAGIGIFGAERDFDVHITLGYLLHLSPALLLVLAVVARVGTPTILWTVALVLVQGVQPLLPMLRADLPWAAALHPVLALVIFWLALTLGLRAWRLVREPAAASAQDQSQP